MTAEALLAAPAALAAQVEPAGYGRPHPPGLSRGEASTFPKPGLLVRMERATGHRAMDHIKTEAELAAPVLGRMPGRCPAVGG